MEAIQNDPTVRVLGISGSLREPSYNRGLLEAAAGVAPPGLEIVIRGVGDLPLYDPNLATEAWPEVVLAFRQAIEEADALLIATPEYNHSIPGALKNGIDWASRPTGSSPLAGKPTAIMGATVGAWGTVRAQWHLRQILASTSTPLVLKPDVLVAGVREKWSEGRLADEATRGFIRELLERLVELVAQLQRSA